MMSPMVPSSKTLPASITVLWAISIALVTVSVFSTAWWISGEPTSEWPAWVSAGGTVVAVGAAIFAGFYAASAFRLESDREERWLRSQESAQAALVTAWPTTIALGSYSITRCSVTIRNASQAPVSNIRLVVRTRAGWDDDPTPTVVDEKIPYFAPTATVDFDFNVGEAAGRPRPDRGSAARIVRRVTLADLLVELRFRDAAGVEWFRDTVGRLSVISMSDAPPTDEQPQSTSS